MKKTILVDINRDSHKTFLVGSGQHKTFIILSLSSRKKEARIVVKLVGTGAHATILGFILGTKTNDLFLQTLQQHEAPETSSNLLIKSVLTDDAKFLYDGGIRVEKSAQKTDAYQRNENLILSDKAHAESKPALEILANDVRCTHGATVGPVSKDQLWYLKSRGIDEENGTQLVTWGFLTSALTLISDTIVRSRVEKFLWKALSKLQA